MEGVEGKFAYSLPLHSGDLLSPFFKFLIDIIIACLHTTIIIFNMTRLLYSGALSCI